MVVVVVTFPFGESVDVVTRVKGAPDGDGNDTWTDSVTTVVGSFAPGGRTENVQGQDTATSYDTVHMDPVPLAATDRLRVRGVVREVAGEPRRFHNPFTGAEILEVNLVSVSG